MGTFEEIADERRGLADLLTGLSPEQQSAQSLCRAWTVKGVVAHLIVPLEVSIPKFVVTMLLTGANFDRTNVKLAAVQAQRPFEELLDVLRSKADHRFTPPGMGPEAPLTDLIVHGLDIRWPLGLERTIPPDRLQQSLDFLTTPKGKALTPKGALDGLRFEARDLGWLHGNGSTVSGDAEAILLAMTGRAAALDRLDGDGVETLRARLAT